MGKEDTLLNALLGALVTVVLSFTGFSPILGGAAAGYLQKNGPGDGARVGALSGLVASLPVFFVFFLFAGVLPFVSVKIAAVSLVFVVFLLVFVVGYTVALSAIGGYVGGYLDAEY